MFAHDASNGAGLEAQGTGYGERDILPDTTFKPLVAQGPCGTHRRCICCGCHRRCNHRRCSRSTFRHRHCHRNVAANISLLLTALPTIVQSVKCATGEWMNSHMRKCQERTDTGGLTKCHGADQTQATCRRADLVPTSRRNVREEPTSFKKRVDGLGWGY